MARSHHVTGKAFLTEHFLNSCISRFFFILSSKCPPCTLEPLEGPKRASTAGFLETLRPSRCSHPAWWRQSRHQPQAWSLHHPPPSLFPSCTAGGSNSASPPPRFLFYSLSVQWRPLSECLMPSFSYHALRRDGIPDPSLAYNMRIFSILKASPIKYSGQNWVMGPLSPTIWKTVPRRPIAYSVVLLRINIYRNPGYFWPRVFSASVYLEKIRRTGYNLNLTWCGNWHNT